MRKSFNVNYSGIINVIIETDKNVKVKIGKFIKERRKNIGISQSELVEKLYVTDRAVSKWENGICMPDVSNIMELCKLLDITINDLYSGKIVACGHSEDAMIATLFTKKEELRGIISLSGNCMKLKEALLYQNYLVFEQLQDMKGILDWYLRKVLTKDTIEKWTFQI